MMSSQLQMAQFQGDPSSAVPVDAGPAGDATGPGGGQEPVLGEATTLDVQLAMELLKTEERKEPIPEEIFERLSRQEKSTLNYELGEATTLDVQLEMELLKTEERKEPIPEEIFERLSRQEKSTLNYEALSQRGSYAEDSALGHESLPWIYRSLVKQYFLSIVSKSEAKSESTSSK